jgi:hypothetical protein
MSESMVERAARWIYEDRNGKGCKPWSHLNKAHRVPYLIDAKAAIGSLYVANGDWPKALATVAEKIGVHESDWNRTIDAILSD